MKKITPLFVVILFVSLLFGCGGDDDANDGSFTPIKLVPQQANIMAFADLARIFDEIDIAGFYEEFPKEPDDPQTFNEALDMLGIEELDKAVLFGDISDLAGSDDLMGGDAGYFGFILMGAFNENQLIDTIESESEAEITTTDYKGYTIYTDDSEDMSIAFLGESIMVISTAEPVRDVIEIREGDQSAVKGEILRTYNDLGSGLFKLAMIMPEELLESMEEDMDGDDAMGINPMAIVEDLKTVGLVVDKRGDSVPIDVRICFADEEAAENMKGMLAFMMGMMDFDEMDVPEEGEAVTDLLKGLEIDLDGSCIEIGLGITSEMIEDMAESFTESFEDFGFGDSLEIEPEIPFKIPKQ